MYNFSDLIGNEHIINSMKKAAGNKMVSHAYIIGGAKGSGKKLLASAFAKMLLCCGEGSESCGDCYSCRTFDSGNNPDMIYVYPTKTKALSVDDIREQVTADVNVKPYNNKYKIYMIPKADTLTIQAQNALLKTLEEPPEYAVFLLLAENIDAFLPTVLSRCVVFNIKPLASEQVRNYLVLKNIAPEEKAGLYAEYSQGSIGTAVKLAESEDFIKVREITLDTLVNIGYLSYFELTEAAGQLEAFKDLTDITDMIYIWYRDVLVYKTTMKDSLVMEKDTLSSVKKEAERASFEGLCRVPKLIMETKRQIKQNVNFVFCYGNAVYKY
ncbi:DNA polymerase III subunit tau [Clostridiales bacterium]|nr:DNA polymerase III subunit tau [Clostridiales bacterium]